MNNTGIDLTRIRVARMLDRLMVDVEETGLTTEDLISAYGSWPGDTSLGREVFATVTDRSHVGYRLPISFIRYAQKLQQVVA